MLLHRFSRFSNFFRSKTFNRLLGGSSLVALASFFPLKLTFAKKHTQQRTEEIFVLAIDQGTSSSRVVLYDQYKKPRFSYQLEFPSSSPHLGWMEQDPKQILSDVKLCIERVIESARSSGLKIDQGSIKAIGITNQRETSILWDPETGEPLYNAIVWNDTRTHEIVKQIKEKTSGIDYFMGITGLPISTYFSAYKIKWMIDHVPGVKTALESKKCLFGTVDSWLIWNFTGGVSGGVHATDVTNASRTNLMNITELEWDDNVCQFFGIPKMILPQIKSSSEIYGRLVPGIIPGNTLDDVPIAGVLGDQQAATVGQRCFNPGDAKNTYGTGCFILMNTGDKIVRSQNGLLTTVAYQLGADQPAVYALEGSIAVAGYGVQWLRDNIKLIQKTSEINDLASTVSDTQGVYFVPAFGGLLAPYWRDDAKGILYGLSYSTTRAHIARSVLESVCFQTCEIIELMELDSGVKFQKLKVDGGMSKSDLTLQIQSDLLGVPVARRLDSESTALGAALAAGLAVGVWDREDVFEDDLESIDVFDPKIEDVERKTRISEWKGVVLKCFENSQN